MKREAEKAELRLGGQNWGSIRDEHYSDFSLVTSENLSGVS
jgi:hypothetical protein